MHLSVPSSEKTSSWSAMAGFSPGWGLRYPQGGCHEAAAAMLWEGHSGLAVGWSFSSKIPAISQKSSLKRKYCKEELASCLDYLVHAPHMAVGTTHIWKLYDPASISGLTGRQHAVLIWLFKLPAPVLKLDSSLSPGMLGEVQEAINESFWILSEEAENGAMWESKTAKRRKGMNPGVETISIHQDGDMATNQRF